MISVVVPTLNEHELLPRLLDSIKKQKFSDYEIIVADAGSTDGTRDIALEYGARVVPGGLPGPGRNAGAAQARGEILFFFDADVVLPDGFLEAAYNEMQERYIDVATCEVRPISDLTLDHAIHRVMNAMIRATLHLDPRAFGFAIFATKRLFHRVGGFDESVTLGEDSDFVKRASKVRKLQFLESTYLTVSVRRFAKEGRLAYVKKGVKLNIYRMFKGEVREDQIDYEFGGYDKKRELNSKSLLDRLERSLIKLEKAVKPSETTEADRAHASAVELIEDVAERLRPIFTNEDASEKRRGDSEQGSGGAGS